MAQNDAFYRSATSSLGKIANLEIIHTKRTIASGYLYDSRWYKPTVTEEASFLVADTRLYTLPCRSVCRYVHNKFC